MVLLLLGVLFWTFLMTEGTLKPELLFANHSGMFLRNLTTGTTKVLISYSQGVRDVIYSSPGTYYTILNNSNPHNYRIVWAKKHNGVEDLNYSDSEEEPSLPSWCITDKACSTMSDALGEYEISDGLRPQCKRPTNMAVNWKDKTVYWSCEDGSIRWFDSDSHLKPRVIQSSTSNKILDIQLDSYAEKLFILLFNDTKNEITLKTTDLEGGSGRIIFKGIIRTAISEFKLILDIHNKKIYLQSSCANPNIMTQMDYDGTEVRRQQLQLLDPSYNTEGMTNWRLVHPLMQAEYLSCWIYGCNDSCHFLTWKGIECVDSIDDYIESECVDPQTEYPTTATFYHDETTSKPTNKMTPLDAGSSKCWLETSLWFFVGIAFCTAMLLILVIVLRSTNKKPTVI